MSANNKVTFKLYNNKNVILKYILQLSYEYGLHTTILFEIEIATFFLLFFLYLKIIEHDYVIG